MIDDKSLRKILKKTRDYIVTNFSKPAIEAVKRELAEKYNVNYGTSTDIFNGIEILTQQDPIDIMDYDLLYKLMVCIKETDFRKWGNVDKSDYIVEKYFTKQDIIDFDRKYINNADNKELSIDNWLQVNEDQYVCVIPIEQLIEWRNLNRIRYNPRTQRRLTEKTGKGGVVYKVITLYEKSLEAINLLMRKNEFISDDITFNIDPTYYESPIILRGKLVIPTKSIIDIIDGFHRLKEMLEVKDMNNDWKYNCIVNITVFDENKANRFILQRDKKNHLKQEQTEEMDQNSEINFIINKLNNNSNFYLKGDLINKKADVFRRMLKDLFELDTDKNKREAFENRRPISIEIYEKILNSFNFVIEKNKLYNSEFSIEYWVVILYIVYFCWIKNIPFDDFYVNVDINKLSQNVIFKNYPTTQIYKSLKEELESV